MNNLDDILNSKNDELKIRANKAAEREKNLKIAEIIRKQELDEEMKRIETERIRIKELERISTASRRRKETIKLTFENALIYGFIGLIIGAVFGFGKGCISYEIEDLYNKSFWEPFVYIPGNALTIGIIGVVIGFFIGISKGQNI
jgi:hypothetical protein